MKPWTTLDSKDNRPGGRYLWRVQIYLSGTQRLWTESPQVILQRL